MKCKKCAAAVIYSIWHTKHQYYSAHTYNWQYDPYVFTLYLFHNVR